MKTYNFSAEKIIKEQIENLEVETYNTEIKFLLYVFTADMTEEIYSELVWIHRIHPIQTTGKENNEKKREKETSNTILQQLGPAEILRTNGRRLTTSREV